eukprot:CAMPEP_0117452596 /NCGR_PEP_ID=MMETSP0759-20121206/9713_1 /TAXON_ID=63605 /ORGANISM="Percolomonas cosmopolitus, Strain WS" /LENGTH=526 /DNA_ID=CAMNT_0005245449 /DNA_START=240 /DNA_END=1816 /DNA_ORIENTATION=-
MSHPERSLLLQNRSTFAHLVQQQQHQSNTTPTAAVSDFFSPSIQLAPASTPHLVNEGLLSYKLYKKPDTGARTTNGSGANSALHNHHTQTEPQQVPLIQPTVRKSAPEISRLYTGELSMNASALLNTTKHQSLLTAHHKSHNAGTSKRKRADAFPATTTTTTTSALRDDFNLQQRQKKRRYESTKSTTLRSRHRTTKVKRPSYKSIPSTHSLSERHYKFLQQLQQYVEYRYGHDETLLNINVPVQPDVQHTEQMHQQQHHNIFDALYSSWDEIQRGYFSFDSEDTSNKQMKSNPQNSMNEARLNVIQDQLYLVEKRIEEMKEEEQYLDRLHEKRTQKMDIIDKMEHNEQRASHGDGTTKSPVEDPANSTTTATPSSPPSITAKLEAQLHAYNVENRLLLVSQLSAMMSDSLHGELDGFHHERLSAEQLNSRVVETLIPMESHGTAAHGDAALASLLEMSMMSDYSEAESEADPSSQENSTKQKSSKNGASSSPPKKKRGKKQKATGGTTRKKRRTRSSVSNQERDV